jgi:steroid delta-isomerase-like uncharacterized protein
VRPSLALAVVLALTIAAIGGTPRSTTAQSGSPTAGCPTTTPEENETLVRRWYDEVWNQGNTAALSELLAPDYVRHNANQLDQRNVDVGTTKAWVQESRLVDFPDIQVDLQELVASGDLVAARVSFTGTNQDEIEEQGDLAVPPTGQPVTWSALSLFRVACGRIAEHWIHGDELGKLQQLGALPDPLGLARATPAAASPAALATPVATCQPATPAANEALVRRFYSDVLDGGNLAAVGDLFDDNIVHHGSNRGSSTGLAAHTDRLSEWSHDLADTKTTIDAVVADGDVVAVRWTVTGTYVGDFEQVGVPGNNLPVTFSGMALFHLACGKIVEEWTNWDSVDIFRQLTAGTGTPTP